MQAALVYFGSLIFLICASMVQAPGSARASDHDAEVLPEVQNETVVDDYQRPEIQRDLDALPFPARRMHELLIEAAASGEIDRLRPYIGQGEDATLLSFGDTPEDPITFLKSLSGDSEGHSEQHRH